MAKCKECVHYGVCAALLGKQEVRIADNACSFAEKCVAYNHLENFVQVVRCKDCRFIIDRADGTHGCYRHFVEDCKIDDFCSCGERKDNERKAD